MDRRNFIGKILGNLAGVPFVAQTPIGNEHIYPKLERIKRFLNLFSLSESLLKKSKIYVKIKETNERILMPGIESVDIDEDNVSMIFQTKPLVLTTNFVFDYIGILRYDGSFLFETKNPVNFLSKSNDKLTIIYDLKVNI